MNQKQFTFNATLLLSLFTLVSCAAQTGPMGSIGSGSSLSEVGISFQQDELTNRGITWYRLKISAVEPPSPDPSKCSGIDKNGKIGTDGDSRVSIDAKVYKKCDYNVLLELGTGDYNGENASATYKGQAEVKKDELEKGTATVKIVLKSTAGSGDELQSEGDDTANLDIDAQIDDQQGSSDSPSSSDAHLGSDSDTGNASDDRDDSSDHDDGANHSGGSSLSPGAYHR